MTRRYRGETLVLETLFETDDGAVLLVDCMPPRQRHPRVIRQVVGVRGSVPDAHGPAHPLRVRQRRAVGAARRRRPARRRGSRRPGGPRGRPARGRGPRARRRLRGDGGSARRLLADLAPVVPPRAAGRRRRRRHRRHRGLVDRLVGALHLRGAVARAGHALAAHPQGAHLRAHGRAGRGPDDLAARAAGRGAQLGLPLLLAARRRTHARGADVRRLRGRGRGLARLAAARGRRRPRRPADHVRGRRRAPPGRVRARLARRLRGLAPGARRQRGLRAASARRVRRGPGRHGRRPRPGRGARPHRLAHPAPHHGLAGVELARARRGHLGGARPAAPVHALEGDGLGRRRPRRARRRVGPRTATPRAGGAWPRTSTRRSAARATTRLAARSPSTTARRRSTRRSC